MNKEEFFSIDLHGMRQFFNTGQTFSYEFRKKQLELLKEMIESNEEAIFAALYKDLKNSKEEAYATETGLVVAEISYTLKRLQKWMKPKKVKTNFVNFPSSSRIYRDPLGVTLIIGSWNYPFQLTIAPLIGAIAGGNCAVLKPSEGAPATSAVITELIKKTFSPEYISVVEGDGSVVVPALMDSFRFDHIFYTGSGNVGKLIYQAAAKELIPVTLELGGKSPAIVEADADLKTTARRIVLGKFVNAGQTCVAPDYVLLHESVEEKLIGEIQKYTEEFFGKIPEESSDYGKIINENRFDALTAYLDDAGKIAFGGEHNREKLFIAPTLLTGVSMQDKIMQEEIFGPLLPVITYKEKEEALNIIRENEKPLSFYLFSGNKESIQWWMNRVSFGGGCINNTIWHLANPNLPFGGVGGSGIGNYHGKYSFETFTHAKSVLRTPVWFDPNMKYPPFKGKMKLLKMFIK